MALPQASSFSCWPCGVLLGDVCGQPPDTLLQARGHAILIHVPTLHKVGTQSTFASWMNPRWTPDFLSHCITVRWWADGLQHQTCSAQVCSVSKSCPTLCNPVACSPPGSSVRRIFLARILEWVVTPSSRGSSWARDQTHVSWITGGFFTTAPPGKTRPAVHWLFNLSQITWTF